MTCRACGSEELEPFVDLGIQPLSNDFRVSNAGQPIFPLEMLVCSHCSLGQLEYVARPEMVFDDTYHYFSSASPTWVADRKELAHRMINMFDLGEKSRVVEIGSNDGYYLEHFLGKANVLGWEPCANVAQAARLKNITTFTEFWGADNHAHDADLINATNVLAHTPDMLGMLVGIEKALKPNGVATLEFPLFTNLIEHNQIDTIYHEHYSYISFYALEKALQRCGLYPWRVEHLPTHGGSVRVFASKHGARFHIEASVEQISEIYPPGVDMQKKANTIKECFWEWLCTAEKPIYGYGAPAKATVLCNYLGLSKDDIEFTVDDSPAKQGKLVPGTNIPVVSFDRLKEAEVPANVVIFPWNLAAPISAKLRSLWAATDSMPEIVTAIPKLTKF